MHKILMVMRREYLATVRTKMFWIGTLAIPIGLILIIALSVAAQLFGGDKQKPLVVIDEIGVVASALTTDLAEHKLGDGSPRYPIETMEPGDDPSALVEEQKLRVLSGEIYGILHAGPDIEKPENFRLYRKSVGDENTAQHIKRSIHDAVVGLRLERHKFSLTREELDALTKRVQIEGYQVREDGATDKKSFIAVLAPTFMFVIILFITLYMYGYSMARGIIQEKSTKVMEVLLGSVSPEQLMAGKIFGIGLVGLTQIGIYGVVANLLRWGAMSASFLTLPDELSTTIIDTLKFSTLGYFVLFFVLGYFLFTGLFAIVGAVCSTEQDAQSLQFPVMMCLMLPYVMTIFFVSQPDSTPAVVASMIPVFTPMVMFMRINVLTPPFWQIALSVVLMLISIYLVNRTAAKVFRIGTLMTGKRPSIAEIFRWARS